MPAKLEIFFGMVWLFVKRFLDGIEELFQPAAEDRAAIYGRIGKKCVENGNINEAVSSLSAALELNATDVEARYKLGLALLKKSAWDDAIDCFKKVISLHAAGFSKNGLKIGDLYYRIALCYDKKGEIDKAMENCKEALKTSPDHTEAHYRLGTLYDKRKMHEYSVQSYQKAIDLNPRKSKYYYSLGLAYDGNGEHTRAIDSFRQAMEAEETEAVA